ncbi:HAD family phosphatase [Flavobacteriaceae bacterium S0825]|uniref:HAD-IA family hydrolase n=1 Tax=Gaetbulibacter sp. S0825 TaxID=2720084 RepID=UPI00142FD431|nr:HAD family phosphatase [Flavobacteriaceae bacterium S0825]NIX65465.1 HAD family phosphatase [Gaetbulibacter sp. S0825]
MIKAVIFDMDGVIVNSEPLHRKAYNEMFKTVGIDVSNQLYESFTGKSTFSICKTLCKSFNLKNHPQELVNLKRQYFKYIFENDSDLSLIEGVQDLIQDYYNNDLVLVLASSASMMTINNVFTKFNLDKYFVSKHSGADLKASKPHPEIFINAAKSSGYNRNECIVIEDSTNGIKAANSANIYCIGYKSKHSKNQDYSTANKVIENFKEISFNKIKDL